MIIQELIEGISQSRNLSGFQDLQSKFGEGHTLSMIPSGAPGDLLLVERASEIIHATGGTCERPIEAEFGPTGLEVRDGAGKKDPAQGIEMLLTAEGKHPMDPCFSAE